MIYLTGNIIKLNLVKINAGVIVHIFHFVNEKLWVWIIGCYFTPV